MQCRAGFRWAALPLIVACGRADRLGGDSAHGRSDSIPQANVKAAIAAGVVSETIPAQPVTWSPGAVDTFVTRTVRGARPRAPHPACDGFRVRGSSSAAYAAGAALICVYFFGDQISAGRAAAGAMHLRGDSTRMFTSNNLMVVVVPGDAAFADALEHRWRSRAARSARP